MILNNFYQYLIKAGYEAQEDYVLFSGPTSFTLNGVYSASSHVEWDGEVYYSTDGQKYKKWDKSVITSGFDSSDNLYKIYLQGKGNTYFRANSWYAMKMTGSNVTVSGSLEALLDAESVSNGIHPPIASGRSMGFIFREFPLISAENLKFPLVSGSGDCYYGILCDCRSLVYPPKILPVRALKSSATYQEMFLNDVSLIKPPMILASSSTGWLGTHGYYYQMFKGCTSLVEPAPVFNYPSNNNNDNANMYQGCTNLTRLPKIVKVANFFNSFQNCSNIKVSETQDSTYQYAFTLPSGGNYNGMFDNTGGTFKGTPVAGTTYYTDHPLVDAYYPLHFSSPNSFTIAQNAGTTSWDGTVEYSTNGYTWNTWDGTTITAVSDGSEYNIYFRGTGNTCLGSSSLDAYWTITGSNVDISGEMDCLLDYATLESRGTLTAASNTYRGLFYGQTALTDASRLIIDTVTGDSCNSMFEGCTNLKYPPIISCTSIEQYSGVYSGMFRNCSSLVETTEFPATDTTGWGYANMFEGCSSLEKVYAFNNTFAAGASFYQMFLNCTSLEKAPELPTTSIGGMCYQEMFKGCTSLTKAPTTLPATMAGWEDECYLGMFNGCTSLTKAPTLPATTLTSSCYKEMFNGCTGLTTAPALPATTLTNNCYDKMFYGCTGLTTAPALPATTLTSKCYYQMFQGCTGLTTAPALPATEILHDSYSFMFYGCSNLETIPDLTSITTAAGFSMYQMFYNCSKVKVYEDSSMGQLFITGPTGSYIGSSMFVGTGGDYKGSLEEGVNYYTSNQLI